MAGRSERRKKWAQGVRVEALEHDFDELEGALDKRDSNIDRRFDELHAAMRRQTNLLVWMLISLATAAVLLALDIAVVQ